MKVASRTGAVISVLIAVLVSYALPDRYVFGGNRVASVATLVILIVLGLSLLSRWLRLPVRFLNWSVLIAVVLILTVNLLSLVKLIQLILYHVQEIDGHKLLASSVAIWINNVLAFALLYWEIDGGGPDDRLNSTTWHADFAFPQPVRPQDANPDWRPNFMDYLFVSFTTATAFSPTDTPPLTTRARTLMLIEAAASLLTIAITAARAVNILS